MISFFDESGPFGTQLPVPSNRFGSFDPRAPLFVSVATNSVITLLIGERIKSYPKISCPSLLIPAGRIWWISRDMGEVLGQGVSRKYNRVIAIM